MNESVNDRVEFERIFKENISREGAERLLTWLSNTDFFTAPASTRYHCAFEGGLVKHSVNVYHALMKHFEPDVDNKESFAICGLLHDVCKAQFYKLGSRNVKNPETGRWEPQPYYSIEDEFPFGHGEKSVFLIERFLRLKPSEAMAIRWHMGGFDNAAQGGSMALSQAYERYPLAVKLHMADIEATYLMERELNPKKL